MWYFLYGLRCFMTGFASVWILANYIILIHADRYPRNMTNISKKVSDHGKKQKWGFSHFSIQLVYVKKSGMWLVYDCSGIQTICESHENDYNGKFWYTNWYMWKSGIRAVCEQNKPYKMIYWPFLLLCTMIQQLQHNLPPSHQQPINSYDNYIGWVIQIYQNVVNNIKNVKKSSAWK